MEDQLFLSPCLYSPDFLVSASILPSFHDIDPSTRKPTTSWDAGTIQSWGRANHRRGITWLIFFSSWILKTSTEKGWQVSPPSVSTVDSDSEKPTWKLATILTDKVNNFSLTTHKETFRLYISLLRPSRNILPFPKLATAQRRQWKALSFHDKGGQEERGWTCIPGRSLQ